MESGGCIDQDVLDLCTSSLWWSDSLPGHFIPGKRAFTNFYIVGWFDLRTGLEYVEKRYILPYREWNSNRSDFQPLATLYRLLYPGGLSSRTNYTDRATAAYQRS
jgi:hypothetical protein